MLHTESWLLRFYHNKDTNSDWNSLWFYVGGFFLAYLYFFRWNHYCWPILL